MADRETDVQLDDEAALTAAASTAAVTKEDIEALGDEYGPDASLADDLRDGFRDVKRAQGESRRLLTLLRGLARKSESEAHHAADEVTRVVVAIQRKAETREE